MSLSAKVKNVLSGDTLVLVPPKSTQIPPPERLLTLQYVRADSYLAKEYLRQLAIGKEIKFSVLYKMASGKEFGDVSAPIFSSLIEHMVSKGLARVKDNVSADSDKEEAFVDNLRASEQTAQKNGLGVWAPDFQEPEIVPLTPEIAAQSKKSPIQAIVERVISGDRIVVRLLVDSDNHVSQPVLLAGIRTARTDDADPNAAKTGHRAKKYVEDHIMMGKALVGISIVGENQSGLPLVLVEHPSGNSIQEKLLENGLAEVVDWQSTLLGSQLMSGYRRAEQVGKTKETTVSSGTTSTPATGSKTSSKNLRPGASVDVQISKIINADTYNVRLPSSEEITVQLASVRAPRPNDTTTSAQNQQALVQMAREFARHHAIGKNATMFVDGHRDANKDLNLDARFLVSLKIGAKDLSEQLVSNGFATVIKHNKQTAHERSMNWDRLVELEDEQKKLAKKGVFASDVGRILTLSTRVVNASENVAKAKTFFNGFSKKGRIAGGWYVEFVSSATRVKLYNPKEGLKLTLILGGLANKSASDDGLDYMNRKYLQRNVEFEIYDQDKVGGFIGNLYANAQARKPVQVELVASGLCALHEMGLSSNPYEADLVSAEESAKNEKKGIWKDYDAAAANKEAADAAQSLYTLNLEAAKPKFFDIEVVDIATSGVISFHHTDAQTSAEFAKFKKDFTEFHAQNASASQTSVDLPTPLTKGPKKNDLVSAKFSENGKYYRARVVNFDRGSNTYEVKHIDFGNIDKVPLSSLRALPRKFAVESVKPFAHTCRLQNVQLPPTKPRDYLTEAMYVLEDLTFDKKLVLSGLPSSAAGVEFDAVLYDSEESLKDASYTINKQLVAEGFGIVEDLCPAHLKEYVGELKKVESAAKRDRLGCWEMGDIRDEAD